MAESPVGHRLFESEIRRLDGRLDNQAALYLRDMTKLDQSIAALDAKLDTMSGDRDRDRGRWAVITYIVTATVGILSAIVVALILRGMG